MGGASAPERSRGSPLHPLPRPPRLLARVATPPASPVSLRARRAAECSSLEDIGLQIRIRRDLAVAPPPSPLPAPPATGSGGRHRPATDASGRSLHSKAPLSTEIYPRSATACSDTDGPRAARPPGRLAGSFSCVLALPGWGVARAASLATRKETFRLRRSNARRATAGCTWLRGNGYRWQGRRNAPRHNPRPRFFGEWGGGGGGRQGCVRACGPKGGRPTGKRMEGLSGGCGEMSSRAAWTSRRTPCCAGTRLR